MIKSFLVMIGLLFALSGCQTLVDELTGQSLAQKCYRANVVYATAIASGEIPAANRAKVASIYKEVKAFCQNPDQNPDTLPIRIAELYAAIRGK